MLSLNILADALLGIFDDFISEVTYFDHKHGEIHLNHTKTITGVYEERVFIATKNASTADSAPTMMTTTSPPISASRLPFTTWTPSIPKTSSMPTQLGQQKILCSDSPDLCAEVGILDVQVTCIDETVLSNGQKQVRLYEFMKNKKLDQKQIKIP